jgi:hypothetical protein
MAFSFSFWDLALWFASSSIVLLLASQLLAPYFGSGKRILIDVKKVRMMSIILSIAFIFTVAIRAISASLTLN